MKSFFKKSIVLSLLSILILPLNLWVEFMITPYTGVPMVYAQTADENFSKNIREMSDEEFNETVAEWQRGANLAQSVGTEAEQEQFIGWGDALIAEKQRREALNASEPIERVDETTAAQVEGFSNRTAGEGVGASSVGDILEAGGEGLVQCSLSSILATLLQQVIGELIGGVLTDLVPEPKVPIKNPTDDAKDKGKTIFGIPVLPSWDAVGYCLVNMIIAYIAQSTIDWVNSGFNGNPAFVTDPEGFLLGIADNEANIFLQQLGDGFLCSPFQDRIRINLHANYLTNYPTAAQCDFGQNSGSSLEDFISVGYGTYEDYIDVTRRNNNYYDLKIGAQRQLQSNILQKQNTAQNLLNQGSGYLPQYGAEGQIVVPGASIYHAVGVRTNLPIDRILEAKDFDQVINQLVESLVRVALGELFGRAQGALRESLGR